MQRAKPLEAMGPSRESLVADACRFQPGVWKLAHKEQVAFLRNCVEILGPSFRLSEKERLVLAEWIEAE